MSEHKGERERLTLRVPAQLHEQLERERADVSLNDFIVNELERSMVCLQVWKEVNTQCDKEAEEEEQHIAADPTLRAFIALHEQMQAMGENDMGDLSYAEATLFHTATELIEGLIASIHMRARA